MRDPSATRYRLPPASRFGRRDWAGESVLFDERTGDTHLLDDVGRQVLLELRRRSPGDASELLAAIAGSLGFEPDEALRAHLAAVLLHLGAIGIIEAEPA